MKFHVKFLRVSFPHVEFLVGNIRSNFRKFLLNWKQCEILRNMSILGDMLIESPMKLIAHWKNCLIPDHKFFFQSPISQSILVLDPPIPIFFLSRSVSLNPSDPPLPRNLSHFSFLVLSILNNLPCPPFFIPNFIFRSSP